MLECADHALKAVQMLGIGKRIDTGDMNGNFDDSVTREVWEMQLRKYDVRHSSQLQMNVKIPTFSKASVLIPLFYKHGQIHILLIIRSKNMRQYSNDVAFPGGLAEDGDVDDIATALREAEEEVNLKPNDVQVLCVLPPHYVDPNNIVTPVVGLIPSDFKPIKNEKEVSKVFSLPLRRFLKDDFEERKSSRLCHVVFFPVFHDAIDGIYVTIWGFTGYLCGILASIIFECKTKMKDFFGNEIRPDTIFDAAHKMLCLVASSVSKAML